MTVGPWRPISLNTYSTKISDIDIRSKVSERLDVNLTVDFSLSDKSPCLASVVLKNPQGDQIALESEMKTTFGHSRAEFGFSAGTLDLWYPVGYGKQPIYTVEISLLNEVKEALHLRLEMLPTIFAGRKTSGYEAA